MQYFIQIHPNDNVLVALRDLSKGMEITFQEKHIVLKQDIPAKHKLFLQDMKKGDEIFMYGVLVGKIQHDVPHNQ